jgi:acyl carrier protein
MKGRAEIREFVQDLLTASGDGGPLADSESLLFSGRLQSIDAVEIVVFLEENFGIDFAQVGFDKEQIDSIDAICALTETVAKSN